MSGLDTLTHTHTHTQDDYRNPRCACAPRVNEDTSLTMTLSSAPLVSRLERFHCIGNYVMEQSLSISQSVSTHPVNCEVTLVSVVDYGNKT